MLWIPRGGDNWLSLYHIRGLEGHGVSQWWFGLASIPGQNYPHHRKHLLHDRKVALLVYTENGWFPRESHLRDSNCQAFLPDVRFRRIGEIIRTRRISHNPLPGGPKSPVNRENRLPNVPNLHFQVPFPVLRISRGQDRGSGSSAFPPARLRDLRCRRNYWTIAPSNTQDWGNTSYGYYFYCGPAESAWSESAICPELHRSRQATNRADLQSQDPVQGSSLDVEG